MQPEFVRVKSALWELRMQSISSLLALVSLRIDAGYLILHHPVSNVNYLRAVQEGDISSSAVAERACQETTRLTDKQQR